MVLYQPPICLFGLMRPFPPTLAIMTKIDIDRAFINMGFDYSNFECWVFLKKTQHLLFCQVELYPLRHIL